MKKAYFKPQIMFEDFALSTNIAGDCRFVTTEPSKDTCGYLDPELGMTVFVSNITGCTYHQPDNNDAMCYHVPVDTNTVFSS